LEVIERSFFVCAVHATFENVRELCVMWSECEYSRFFSEIVRALLIINNHYWWKNHEYSQWWNITTHM